ncbi:hypothetical protein T440DRAFT_109336 [Plenodomus tracheiphilus IPT5]|uniref:Uncharacterized protein n=1 Tax=Plenodomus tracheiphilus IPT5 TaxID=1408161 RepID=A0A6A7B7H1_9PLEO|nr:hypothetical protein T440DRAFT_109336 [Plenodomus tracheiphilus IPT5]
MLSRLVYTPPTATPCWRPCDRVEAQLLRCTCTLESHLGNQGRSSSSQAWLPLKRAASLEIRITSGCPWPGWQLQESGEACSIKWGEAGDSRAMDILVSECRVSSIWRVLKGRLVQASILPYVEQCRRVQAGVDYSADLYESGYRVLSSNAAVTSRREIKRTRLILFFYVAL